MNESNTLMMPILQFFPSRFVMVIVQEFINSDKKNNDNGQDKKKESTLSTKKAIKKERTFDFDRWFLGRFLGRECVFFLFSSFLLKIPTSV